jgi:hypothetical protein
MALARMTAVPTSRLKSFFKKALRFEAGRQLFFFNAVGAVKAEKADGGNEDDQSEIDERPYGIDQDGIFIRGSRTCKEKLRIDQQENENRSPV